MKKILVIFAAVMCLAACSEVGTKYDNPEQHLIGIFPVNGVATKAPVVGTVMPNYFSTSAPDAKDRTIEVAAYYNEVNADTDPTDTDKHKNFFPFSTFRFKDGSTNTWQVNRFWPFSGTLSMIAYTTEAVDASGNIDHTVAPTNTANYSAGFTFDYGKNTVGAANHPVTGDDLMAGRVKDATKADGQHNVTFKHAKALLKFMAKTNDDGDFNQTDNFGVKISKISLKNAEVRGVLTTTADPADGNNVLFSWNLTGAPAPADVDSVIYTRCTSPDPDTVSMPIRKGPDATTWNELTTAASDSLCFMLPQQTATDIVITYDLHNGFDKDGNPVITKDLKYVYKHAAPVLTWESGKKYVYNITMTLEKIQIDAYITDWTTVTPATPIDIPQEP